jgi:hypothetical protein
MRIISKLIFIHYEDNDFEKIVSLLFQELINILETN